MVDLNRSLLGEMSDLFADKGWPVTDLAHFRMQDEGEEPDDDDTEEPEGGKQLSADDITRMERALKKANKEAETARLKLKEIEDAGKSETQKVTEERDALRGDLTTAQAVALRYEIALDKGIPKSIATRLQGSTREEMEKDADELLKTLTGVKKPPSLDGGVRDEKAPSGGSFLSDALREKRRA